MAPLELHRVEPLGRHAADLQRRVHVQVLVERRDLARGLRRGGGSMALTKGTMNYFPWVQAALQNQNQRKILGGNPIGSFQPKNWPQNNRPEVPFEKETCINF